MWPARRNKSNSHELNRDIKIILVALLLAGCGTQEPELVTLGGMEMKTIPGLTAGDVCRNYRATGFKTQIDVGPEMSVWTTLKPFGSHDLIITITGKKASEIIAIDAVFVNYIHQDLNAPVTSFLGGVAALPYSRSKPAIAKQWAASHITRGGDTTIGDVSLRLTNLGDTVHVLKMSVGRWR